ncbi:hypothetical protein EV426DRAFT_640951 [Tirmania nivea]|nr:hypothetical protein EV426DRAFT_640951 [Tirmania nivea]
MSDIEMCDTGDNPGWEDEIEADAINQALDREILEYKNPKKGKKKKGRGPGKRMVEETVNSPIVSERFEKVYPIYEKGKVPVRGSLSKEDLKELSTCGLTIQGSKGQKRISRQSWRLQIP